MFLQYYLGNKKQNFLTCNSEQVYAAILETRKNKDLSQNRQSTLTGSLKFPKIFLTWFP